MDASAQAMERADDETLVIRLQDGDIRAFEELVARYQVPLLAFARRTLGDAAEAEDVVQDALLSLWHNACAIREAAAIKTWIYRLVANGCFDVLRQRRRHDTTAMDAHHLSELSDSQSTTSRASGSSAHRLGFPEQQAESNAAVDALKAALAELPDDQRMTWVLFELQGLTYDEISRSLELTTASVRGKIYRARKSIATKMAGWK
ncbi:RNA polymerase sigma factor [Brevibacterium gallinarum]|uniref:Sigma-70 family RNA polymerase sigma factor n=1 Tax=Brevibacterium gallinarum TaxID=2762220 RepID=A0ABR8WRP7_9MICO|nr:sigma-70 family RNA polymerase sigma factor [Brevibacterium gallinarum]MBD8019765.1 sigma-70 family RNA polymerase sigma factor [Brevibacterium gallinarum]